MSDAAAPSQQASRSSAPKRPVARGGLLSGVAPMVIGVGVLALALGGGGLWLLSRGDGPAQGGAGGEGRDLARTYTTDGPLEVRREPKADAPLIVTLRSGTVVSGVPAQAGWLEVTSVDGTKGFARGEKLKPARPATASTEVRPGTRRIIVSTLVNLRASPSLSGRVLGVADGGTRLVADGSIVSEGEDWLRVPLDADTIVFVLQRYTTADDDPGGDREGFEATASIGVKASVQTLANVQVTPLPDGRIIRALQPGEEVRVIGQTLSGGWWYVLRLNDGSQGFAPRDAIRIDPTANRWMYPDGTPAPGPGIPKGATSAGGLRTVATSSLRVRSEANADSEVIGGINAGQPLVVVGQQGGWLQIRLPDGRTGWVGAQYTARIGSPARPAARRVSGDTADSGAATADAPADAPASPSIAGGDPAAPATDPAPSPDPAAPPSPEPAPPQ